MVKLPANIKEFINSFENWYNNDPHSESEDYYQDKINYQELSQLSKNDFLAFFFDFANEGGKVQSQGHRNAKKFIENVNMKYEEFRFHILETFSSNLNIKDWLKWSDTFNYFGRGLATIFLNRVNKNEFVIVNRKSINAYQILGYEIRETSLDKTYFDIKNAQSDLIRQFPIINNYFKADAIAEFIIGKPEGRKLLAIEENNEMIGILNTYLNFCKESKDDWNEGYKWETIAFFQANKDIDTINSTTFLKELNGIQLNLANNLQYATIVASVERFPDKTREIFKVIFDEDRTLKERFDFFNDRFSGLVKKLNPKKPPSKPGEAEFAFFLSLMYPDKYYLYREGYYIPFANYLGIEHKRKYGEKYIHYLEIIEEFKKKYVLPNNEVINKTQELLDEYSKENELESPLKLTESKNMLTQSIIYIVFSILGLENEFSEEIETEINEKTPNSKRMEKNIILYGPPGTGKTYHTINKAVEIANPELYKNIKDDREKLKIEFKNLKEKGIIQFVTFHQSMSYEDFIEGIKPVITNNADDDEIETDDLSSELKYRIEDGIFKQISDRAAAYNEYSKIDNSVIPSEILNKAKFYKVSLGHSNDKDDRVIYDYCINNDCIAIGYGGRFDYSNEKSRIEIQERMIREGLIEAGKMSFHVFAVERLKLWMKEGDIVFVSNGNTRIRAIGQITGDYYFQEDSGIRYCQFRKVKWLAKNVSIPVQEVYTRIFSQQTIYQMYTSELKKDYFLKTSGKSDIFQNYVLIIDEINRGNIANIFGELITLIEPDKRTGAKETLSAILPYSKTEFSVPSNLYIIGSMNTADRSVEAIDTALRRRFSFVEMPPDYTLKELDYEIAGYKASTILETINSRIEKLLDKDHLIGHSYFMNKDGEDDVEKLQESFYKNIIPLLQEYFYGDFGKIGLVLGAGFVEKKIWKNDGFANFVHESSAEFEEKEVFQIIDYRKNSVKGSFNEAIKLLMNEKIE
jgi:hypothetical protein